MGLFLKDVNPQGLSPLTLAFVGDAVFSVMVREHLINLANRPVGDLHKESIKMVNAVSQAKALDLILPDLTVEELAIYKRGRNAHTGTVPKSSSVAEYHKATGLEALFGHLYLSGQTKRLEDLFEIIVHKQHTINMQA